MRCAAAFLSLFLAFPVMANNDPTSNTKETGRQEIRIPMRPSPALSAVLVDIKIDNQDALVLVDTGTTRVIIDANMLKLKSKPERSAGFLQLDGHVKNVGVMKETIIVAGISLNVDAMDTDLQAQRKLCKCDLSGIIGLNVLQFFSSIELNFKTKELVFKP